MKKNGLLIIALAAIAAGLYFATKGKAPSASKVGSTGTATTQATNFWDALVGRAASAAGQGANRVVNGGSVPSTGKGVDVGPVAKEGVKAAAGLLGSLGQWFKKKLFGGSQTTAGTSPGTSDDYGNDPFADLFDGYNLNSEPEYSEGGGFNGPAWIPDGSPYLYTEPQQAPQRWDNTNDLPIDDAYNDATAAEDFMEFGA